MTVPWIRQGIAHAGKTGSNPAETGALTLFKNRSVTGKDEGSEEDEKSFGCHKNPGQEHDHGQVGLESLLFTLIDHGTTPMGEA